MKIGFIENKMKLISIGSCNLMMEWVKLLREDHEVDILSYDEPDKTNDKTYSDERIIKLNKDSSKLENYQMLFINNLGEPNKEFYEVIKNCKRAITYFVFHERSVIRDIYTEKEIMNYINACDYILTYQPDLLEKKFGIEKDRLLYMNELCFYKDPTNYAYRSSKSIDFVYCNRTNDFKGASDCMGWFKYLHDNGHEGIRLMKGFDPKYPHKNLANYEIGENGDFITENYGDHKECKDLLQKARFVWCAQNFDKYPEEHFKDKEEYMSYLNFDLDGTSLEAVFSGCIPILHIEQMKRSEFIKENKDAFLFYDPDKGYEDLFYQIKMMDYKKKRKVIRDIIQLYKCKDIFKCGLNQTILPQKMFDLHKAMMDNLESIQ